MDTQKIQEISFHEKCTRTGCGHMTREGGGMCWDGKLLVRVVK